LLQFIWQNGHFNKANLLTTSTEPLQIIRAGTLNFNQGPDFLDGKIKIGDTIWAGNIELHVRSSHWELHKHTGDSNYGNVILHVVWQHDAEVMNNRPLAIPTLELEDKVPKLLMEKYDQLMNNPSIIPCEKVISSVPELTWLNWKERLLVERLQKKSAVLLDYLHQNNNHWEESFWWLIARNFGAKVNSEAFEKIAQSVPLNVFTRTKSQVVQIEAILFGQANLLRQPFKEAYPNMLRKEYDFFRKKFGLRPALARLHFLRMRPSNFPTIRIAQLAMLLHQSNQLFAKILATVNLREVKSLLDVTANDYWHYHYIFDEESAFKEKHLGDSMINNIIINTIVPAVFAYGKFHNNEELKTRSFNWLSELAAENNAITNKFLSLEIVSATAFDSQALIQLKNEYCNQFRCLDCAVGNWILKKD
jgi:hypothetical protein